MSVASQSPDEVQDLKSKFQTIREIYIRDAKQLLFDSVQQLFDTTPELGSISWTAYTPYWADGDPCKFEAYVNYPEINEHIDPADVDKYRLSDPQDRELTLAVRQVLTALKDEDYLLLFGDHIRVVIVRGADGKIVSNVTKCDHE